jgi:RHS repeat-associated protein
MGVGSRVVTKLERVVANMETLYQRYAYENAIYNSEGLGFLGFTGLAVSNWHTAHSDRVYNVRKFDPLLRGIMTYEYIIPNFYTFTVPSSGYISKTEYQNGYSISSNKVFKSWVESSLNQNSLYGTYNNTTFTYNTYNLPTSVYSNYSGDGTKTVNINYQNNTGNSTYYIGRILNKTESSTVGSELFNTEQQFIYSGYLVSEIKTKGNGTPFDSQTFTYDGYGNVTSITATPNDETSRTTSMEYDPSGLFLEKVTDLEGQESTYNYDTISNTLTNIIDPYGFMTSFEYDDWYRPNKQTDYLGNETNMSYSESSNHFYSVNTISDDGANATSIYDPLKRITESKSKNINGDFIKSIIEYDKFDRPYKVSQPLDANANASSAQWNETEYDFYGRPTKQTLYTGRVINISYSGLTTTVDDGVKIVSSTVNALGNVVSVTDPGGTINYTYFGNGNLKSSNYNGVIVQIEQDGWGRKTKLTDPSAGVYEYEYNGFSEVTKEITPKGETDYQYDNYGKLTHEEIAGDNIEMFIDYNYHPTFKQQISTISQNDSDGNNSSYNYTYDSYGRAISMNESNPFANFNKIYTYDSFGRLETEKSTASLLTNGDTSRKKVKNIYQNGYLKAIRDFNSNANIWEVSQINTRGQVTEALFGNNLKNNNTYDNYGYLTENTVIKTIGSTSETLMQLTTDFNAERGTLNSRSNSMFSWSETFGYDELDRLITFNDNNDDDNFHDYDDFGRITTNSSIGDYNYSGTSYQFDDVELNNQGDLYYQQNQLQQVKYNAFKKPFEISEAGKEKIGFQYNAFKGRAHMFYGDEEDNVLDRVNRKHYSYDGSMEISYNTDADISTIVTYIGGDAYSAPAMWRVDDTDDVGYYYLHRDYLGSIMLITNEDGNAEEKRHFDAWGTIVKIEDGNGNTLDKLTILDRGYTGHEHLQGVGIIHMNGRLYDPKLKRFLSPDNYIQDMGNTQNFNRYSYVLNNPLMYTDPSGEMYTGGGTETPNWGAGWGATIATIAGFWDSHIKGAQVGRWLERNFSMRNFSDFWDRTAGGFLKRVFGKKKKKVRTLEAQGTTYQDPIVAANTNTSPENFNAAGSESGLGIALESIDQKIARLGALRNKLRTPNVAYAHEIGGGALSPGHSLIIDLETGIGMEIFHPNGENGNTYNGIKDFPLPHKRASVFQTWNVFEPGTVTPYSGQDSFNPDKNFWGNGEFTGGGIDGAPRGANGLALIPRRVSNINVMRAYHSYNKRKSSFKYIGQGVCTSYCQRLLEAGGDNENVGWNPFPAMGIRGPHRFPGVVIYNK